MIDEKKLIAAIEAYAKDKTAKGCWYDRLWGLHMAIEIINAQPKAVGWIPCSERLPGTAQDLEVTCKNGDRFVAYYSGRNWYHCITNAVCDVIAWKEPSEPWEGEDDV